MLGDDGTTKYLGEREGSIFVERICIRRRTMVEKIRLGGGVVGLIGTSETHDFDRPNDATSGRGGALIIS